MNPRFRDMIATSAGLAHADSERGLTDAAVARRYSTAGRKVSRRTANEWRRTGPPEVREFSIYLLACSDPFRIEASIKATVKQIVIAKLSDQELVHRYRELLEYEPIVEAEDRVLDVERGACWLRRAAASERDSAINAEKAACERELAARGLTETEVLG